MGQQLTEVGCEGRKVWARWVLEVPGLCPEPPLSPPGFIHCSSPSAQGIGRKFPLCDVPEHTQVHRAEVSRISILLPGAH